MPTALHATSLLQIPVDFHPEIKGFKGTADII